MGSDQWPLVRLGDLVQVQHGWPFKSDFFSEELTGSPIVVNIGNFQYSGGFRFGTTTVKEYRADYPPQYELKQSDILLVMTCQTAGGEILGIPGRIPGDGRTYLHNQRLGKVVIIEPHLVDHAFLYWLFLTPEFNRELYLSATGTKILHTAPQRIESFRFNLPPIPEQRAIASILGALDDKIELNQRMNATLEAMAAATFKSWFVDFDPMRAKMDGRQPPGMDEETAKLFPEAFERDDELLLPSGWRSGTIGEIGSNPRRSVKPEQIHSGTPYIGLEHMPRNCMALSDWGIADTVNSTKLRFLRGEILFGKLRPYFHKVGVAPIDGVCSTDIIVAAPKTSAWFGFLLGHMSSNELVQYTDMSSTGTRMPRTNWRDISRYRIVIPPIELAAKMTEHVLPLVGRINAHTHESRTLAALRDTLLPKLLSGELRVADADRLVEGVL